MMSAVARRLEEKIDAIVLSGRRHPHSAAIPDELRGWLLGVAWDVSRLHRIEQTQTEVVLSDLVWHFSLPWWRDEVTNEWFQVRPVDVIDRPAAYPIHTSRMRNADLAFPLHVVRRRGRWQILDGIHRAARAAVDGVESIRVIEVSPDDFATTLIQ